MRIADPRLRALFWRLFVQPPLIPLLLLASFVGGFWNPGNLRILMDQVSIDGILMIAMTIVMIAGGFDLSVGAVMALGGVVAVVLLPQGLPVAMAGATLAGTLCGCLSGTLVTRLRINPFIATLAVMMMVRGGTLTWTATRPVIGLDDAFLTLGRGSWGLPIAFWVLLAVIVAAQILLAHRAWGRHVTAVGGDERAAMMAGLPVARLKMQCYALSGGLAGIAGLMLAARLGTGSPIIGETAPLTAAAAALLGGATLRGGEGSVAGSCAGLLFIAVMINVMNLLGVPSYYQRMSIGGILLLLVALVGTLPRLRSR